MSVLNKIRSLFGKENSSNAITDNLAEKETIQDLIKDDSLIQTFILGESEYRHQPIRLERYEQGEPIQLGPVVDALMGEDVSSHITGVVVDLSNIDKKDNRVPAYISSSDDIRNINIKEWLLEVGEHSHLKLGENVVLTLFRDNGLSIVLHFRNMLSIPYLVYTKVTTMVSGTSSNDDMRSTQHFYRPQFRSTLLSFRRDFKDISALYKLYERIEEETLKQVKNKDENIDKLHMAFLQGLYGLRSADDYFGYGRWLQSENRPYDALRQFERLLNIIDNPQENLNNGAAFGHVNHRIAQCLIQIGDRPRAFHYMEVANFFDHNLVKEKLHLLASLCDFRIPKILEDNAKKYDPDVIRDIWACHELAKDCYMQMIKDERPYVSLGFVLSQLFRVHPYNIFGMHLCHGKDGNTSNKEILEVKDVWNYRLSDALADGNTIVLSYSQAEYQCKMENDKSMLCPSNVIIFHVSAIPGKTMFRIDMMVPPFVFDSDHIRPREGDTPIYRSIVLPAEDYVYDFSQNTETLLKCARSLDKDKRYVEAMLGYHYAYVSLVPKMKSISPSERGNCAVAASLLGSCFLEMDMMYKFRSICGQ